MNDLMRRLQDARPTDADLDRLWPVADRERVLRTLSADRAADRAANRAANRAARRGPRRGRWLAAAALAGGLVIVPNVIGSGAAEAELRALAMAAVSADGPVIAEGTYLHVKTESVQRNSSLFGDGRTVETNRESWVRWDGKIWAVDSRPSAGWTEYQVFEPAQAASIGNPTPQFAASLPQDAAALGKYLHATVQGSNSHEEAMFVAVADLAHSNFLPPRTLAAALEVLADVDGVEAKEVVVRGREAVEISFSRFFTDLVASQTYTLDKATARVIAVEDSDPGSTYESDTTLVEVVDDIPQDVREAFDRHGDGHRVYDDGRAPRPGDL